MSYDVYYATGGGSLIYGGSDVWVNNWLREVAPKLKHSSKLLIHRRRPDNVEIDFEESSFSSAFKINNPDTKSTCGCGSSFS